MRYIEIISEKIVNRPYRLGTYVANRSKEVGALLAQVRQSSEIIKENDQDGDSMLRTFLRYGSDYNDAANDISSLTYALRNSGPRELERVSENLESVLRYGNDPGHGSNFWGYLMSALKNYKPLEENDLAVIQLLPVAKAGAEMYGYDPEKPETLDEEYESAMRLHAGVVAGAQARTRADAVVKDMAAKLGEIMNIKGSYTDKYRPEHGEIETLYHTSAFCTEIIKNGFSAEKPEGRRGLGNYGDQPEISFTSSLDIAHTLSRCLKEVWMIAHGQLTAKQIASWIAKEGLDPAKIESSLGISHPTGEMDYFGKPRTRLKRLSEITDAGDTAKLYRVYLAYSEMRTDPLFTYIDATAEMMKTRKLSDIGVLQCEVRLSKDDQYLIGESEFRVTADKVMSMRRLF